MKKGNRWGSHRVRVRVGVRLTWRGFIRGEGEGRVRVRDIYLLVKSLDDLEVVGVKVHGVASAVAASDDELFHSAEGGDLAIGLSGALECKIGALSVARRTISLRTSKASSIGMRNLVGRNESRPVSRWLARFWSATIRTDAHPIGAVGNSGVI